jgi:hypothetical protein
MRLTPELNKQAYQSGCLAIIIKKTTASKELPSEH